MTPTDQETSQPNHPPHCPQCSLQTEANRPFCSCCGFDLRYGSPKRLSAGFCVYCGKYGKLSAEHIFPDWLASYYPRRSKETLHHLNRPERHEFFQKVENHGMTYRRKGDPYIEKVWNVCASCNNGWMSTLQNFAKPLVRRLADGEWPNFLERESDLLARWATMVSINFQCYARQLTTSELQRETLMNGSMPSGWRISIGSMKTTDSAGSSFHRHIQVPLKIDEKGNDLPILSTYFCIEHVAFHTLSSLADLLLFYGMKYGVGEVILPMRGVWPFDPDADQAVGRGLVKDDLIAIQRQFGDRE